MFFPELKYGLRGLAINNETASEIRLYLENYSTMNAPLKPGSF